MGLFNAAQNGLDLMSATVAALQIFERLSLSDRPKDAMQIVRAVVITLIEGYQGKIRGKQIQDALAQLHSELHLTDGVPNAHMVEMFKAAL